MTTSTTGTGTITLGSASNGFQSFADAGVANGDVVQYVIEEGSNFEIGTGTYSSTGTSLTRTPTESSNSDAAITLAGQATVSITAVADDLNRLQHEGSTKVSVSATGASVTGALTTSGDLTVNGEVAADLSFGDNVKAKFGASDDLQIYHDGSNSYIDDAGSGRLNIRTNDLRIEKYTGETIAKFIADGAVELNYNDVKKLATTSTGIDVTGTVTADGLTVDGNASVDGALTFTNQGVVNAYINSEEGFYFNVDSNNDQSTERVIQFGANATDSSGKKIALFQEGGDISFYEDTGTTAKFFWDASAESLGIGTSSPSATLELNSATQNAAKLKIGRSTVHSNYLQLDTSGGESQLTAIGASSVYGSMIFSRNNGTTTNESMRIDSSGNLLVGKTSADGTATDGSEIRDGRAYFSAASGSILHVNRTTTDGEIIDIRKNGTTVGSIGSYSSGLDVAGSSRGIRFSGSTIFPVTNAGGVSDNSVQLGYSGGRFKDLYLSGTANAANFNTTSDATLKTNVETLTGSLDAVKALRGVSYDWIDSGSSEVGVIAQEVEAVVPDVVSTNDQGIKSVKYGNLVGVLIEAIKEQQQRIEALEAKLNS